jgi:thiol-disulfide isomerase/thioredoxin
MNLMSNILTLLLLLMPPDSNQSTVTDTLATGREAPRFWTSSLDGSDFYLSRKVGSKARTNEKKALVLSFFSTTCIPCRQEIPFLDSLQAEYPQIGFYLVNVGEESQLIKEYVQKMQSKLPVLTDRYAQVAKKYQAMITPTLVGIDPKGQIAFFKRGFRIDDKTLIRNKIRQLADL